MAHTNIDQIFNELDKYHYPKEVLDTYALIKKYSGRIHFVKDHNGVKNLLFFSTLEAANTVYENPYFSLFTIAQKSENNFEAYVSYTAEEILKETKKFLENSDEVLYVSIGFVESQVTNEDYWNIFYLMEDTKCAVTDAFVTLRRFPSWYDELADYPYFIQRQEALLSEMEENELRFLKSTKIKIIGELKKVIEKNDETEFEKLSEKMKIIINQLKEKGAY